MTEVDELDLARAQEYLLLAALLARSPDAEFLGRLAQLRGDDSELGRAHAALAQAAARTDASSVAQEYFSLFVGLGRGELLPYASYYLTGSMHALPLANLRVALIRLGIERAEGQSEPEDHVAILFEIMAKLASGAIAARAGADRDFFDAHLTPWIAKLFRDLEQAGSADFYATVAKLGGTFVEIERQAFLLVKAPSPDVAG